MDSAFAILVLVVVLALAFDYAAMAVTDLMSISERRIDRLVNPDANEDLPPFLTTHAGSACGARRRAAISPRSRR